VHAATPFAFYQQVGLVGGFLLVRMMGRLSSELYVGIRQDGTLSNWLIHAKWGCNNIWVFRVRGLG